MKRLSIAFTLLFSAVFVFNGCKQIDDIIPTNTSLSNDDIVKGLKSALQVGTDSSVTRLSAADGYYKDLTVKILLPDEAQVIYNQLSKIPGGDILVENTIQAINRAAEDAAPEATTIFVNAITNITISDGLKILNGADTAATTYLKDNTYADLVTAFSPKINTSLGKPLVAGQSAASLYTSLVNAYNTASLNGLLFPKITQNTLGEYVTAKALNGLFKKVANEEIKIRTDVSHQVNDILKKVFGK